MNGHHEQLNKNQDNMSPLSHPTGTVSGLCLSNYIHIPPKPHCLLSLESFLSLSVYKWDNYAVKLDNNDESCFIMQPV